MYQKKLEADLRSPLEFGLDIFSGKWHSRIICELSWSYPLRFSQLKALLPGITDTALAHALRKLTAYGILERTQYDGKPAKVEYALSEKGWSVIPIFESICQWAGQYYQPKEDQALQKCHHCVNCFRRENTAPER